jgi:hypothetical protein
VSPQSKRRRLSLLTLPVVVAVGFLLVIALASWRRSDLIAELTDCISHGETQEAIGAVHKLAMMPNPPVAVLVTLAASDEHETANAARVSLDRLLRRWQRDVESTKSYGSIGTQLGDLAKCLAETQTEFSNADHAWLESAVRRILRMANKFPPAKTPLVAVHCDAIFSAIGGGRLPGKPDELPGSDDFDGVVAGIREVKASPQPALVPPLDVIPSANKKSPSAEAGLAPVTPPAKTDLLHSDDDTADNSIADPPINDLRIRSGGLEEDPASDRLSSDSRLPGRSLLPPPIFRILPAMPIHVLPNEVGSSNRPIPESLATADRRGDASAESLASAESRDLLRTWLAAENGGRQSIERELARRGFGKLSTHLVQQFFSDDPQERMRLVDKVVAQIGGGSEAWLVLLSGDSDADVRLFAVTFMATSNNAALVEKAWQAAIRDQDPRVADLAGRLRERREGPLRR